MTERSYFWNTAGGGDGAVYTQAHLMDRFFRAILNGTDNRGVLRGWRNELEVTGTSNTVSVASGGAILYGMFYENDMAVNVTIPAAASGTTRTDLIVVRRSWAAKTCRILRIAGPGATLTQTAGTTWDIPLASVLVTSSGGLTVTDTRECCTFGTLFPLNSIDTAQFDGTPIPLSKIANRTRYQFCGAGRMEGTGWTTLAGAYNSYTDSDLWTFFMPPTGIASGADFYVWSSPAVNGAGAGPEYVWWGMTIYQCVVDNPAAEVEQIDVLVDQQLRENTRFYADRVASNVAVSPGMPVIVLLERSPVWPSSSASASGSPSLSPSASGSRSPSASLSPSPSASLSPSASESVSGSASLSPSASESVSGSASLSPSASTSSSPSQSQSGSASLSPSASASASASASPAWEDTYGSTMHVLGIEMRYTADA